MELYIRDVQPEDAEAIVGIFNPIIETGRYTVFDSPFSVAAERDYILNMSERDLFHIAVERQEHKIVGFQSMSPFASYSNSFTHVGVMGTFVDMAYQRQGIAKRLFAATFEAAKKKGYEKIFTYVRADNPRALATYLSQGFKIVGTAHKHAKIRGNYVDEIIIEKWL